MQGEGKCLKDRKLKINAAAIIFWWITNRQAQTESVCQLTLEAGVLSREYRSVYCKTFAHPQVKMWWNMKPRTARHTYVAFPSRRKMQERENCSVADTTFFDRGLNLSLTSVWVGMGLAYCFMLMLLVAKAFRRPDGDSCGRRRLNTALDLGSYKHLFVNVTLRGGF